MPLEEMYSLTLRQNTWGIDGYEIPKSYFDHMKQIKDKEYEEIRRKGKYVKSNKYVTKRGFYLEDELKIFKNIPGPNKYDVSHKWVQNTEKGKQQLHSNSKRNTFIDEIFQENKKRGKPGPGQYNIFFKTQPEIKESPEIVKKRRENFGRKLFLNEYEYLSIKSPGPGNYNPRPILPKLMKNNKKPEDFIKQMKEQIKMKGKKSSMPDMGTYQYNFPLDFDTFGKMLYNSKQKQKSAIKYLGTEVRFRDFKKSKSQSTVIVPGPGQYQMVAQWPGKINPKQKDKKQRNYMDLFTKGVQKSIYYEKD